MILTNNKELFRKIKIGGKLIYREHGTVEFRILRGGNKANNRFTNLDFRRVDFGLFRNQTGRISRKNVLARRGVQES